MKPPCADTLTTRILTPVAGSGTLDQPKFPTATLGATH